MASSIRYLLIAASMLVILNDARSDKSDCNKTDGSLAKHGSLYHPNLKEPCMECFCFDGFPVGCATAWCAPPECDWKAVEGKCCEFICRPNKFSWWDWLFGDDDEDEVVLDGSACVDGYGKNVKKGDKYIPYNFEDCVMCTCDAGPTNCSRVKCVPPQCPRWEKVKDECCKYNCID